MEGPNDKSMGNTLTPKKRPSDIRGDKGGKDKKVEVLGFQAVQSVWLVRHGDRYDFDLNEEV